MSICPHLPPQHEPCEAKRERESAPNRGLISVAPLACAPRGWGSPPSTARSPLRLCVGWMPNIRPREGLRLLRDTQQNITSFNTPFLDLFQVPVSTLAAGDGEVTIYLLALRPSQEGGEEIKSAIHFWACTANVKVEQTCEWRSVTYPAQAWDGSLLKAPRGRWHLAWGGISKGRRDAPGCRNDRVWKSEMDWGSSSVRVLCVWHAVSHWTLLDELVLYPFPGCQNWDLSPGEICPRSRNC